MNQCKICKKDTINRVYIKASDIFDFDVTGITGFCNCSISNLYCYQCIKLLTLKELFGLQRRCPYCSKFFTKYVRVKTNSDEVICNKFYCDYRNTKQQQKILLKFMNKNVTKMF